MTVALLLAALDDDRNHGLRHSDRRRESRGDLLAPRVLLSSELTKRIRAGERSAFDELYLAVHHDITTFISGYVGSWLIAEELVQDLFLRLWTKHAELRIETSLRSYLFGAARNAALNYLDRKRVESAYVVAAQANMDSSESNVANEVGEADDRVRVLRAALLELPERQRGAVMLRYVNDMIYDEIGAVLGISKIAARSLVLKAEARLRRALRAVRW
jgi:RNA polymerase sigma-70 factor, ECF subfamily